MRTYDHLFFDLDNTLWDFTANSKLAMYQNLEQHGILTQLNSFESFFKEYEHINKLLWRDYHLKRITKQTLIVERFSRSLQLFGLNDLNYQELNSDYLKYMALQTALFPNTIDTLQTLKAKGYQMYIITNGFREVQYEKIKNCRLSEFFSRNIRIRIKIEQCQEKQKYNDWRFMGDRYFGGIRIWNEPNHVPESRQKFASRCNKSE
jgi:putative hydrolase of the HAD superfamily